MCHGFCLLRLLWRSNWSMCASIHQQFDDAADDVTTPVRQYWSFWVIHSRHIHCKHQRVPVSYSLNSFVLH